MAQYIFSILVEQRIEYIINRHPQKHQRQRCLHPPAKILSFSSLLKPILCSMYSTCLKDGNVFCLLSHRHKDKHVAWETFCWSLFDHKWIFRRLTHIACRVEQVKILESHRLIDMKTLSVMGNQLVGRRDADIFLFCLRQLHVFKASLFWRKQMFAQ